MPPEGQNLRDHLMGKYGITVEQSVANRERIIKAGADVDFPFNFSEETRTYNTLAAHQLIHWAREVGEGEKGKEHEMKLALLKAYFTDARDVSDLDVLVDVAQSIGLDGDEARKVLEDETYLDIVRQHMAFWQGQGITGVPAVILNSKYLVNGAAGTDHFKRALEGAWG